MYRFYFVLLCIWAQFSNYKPPRAYFWRGDLTEGFLPHRFGGLIFGGVHFRNFTFFPWKTRFWQFLCWLAENQSEEEELVKYAVSSQLVGRHQKGKRVSYTRPSPPLQKKKGWFHDQNSFLKQGGSAVGGDIVVKEVLALALLSCLPHLR